jgi:hypothetical protein
MVGPMKKAAIPLVLFLALCPVLAGCSDSDWNGLLNYGAEEEAAVTPVTSVSQASAGQASVAAEPAALALPANADFCRGVATQDATTNGFDPATQQRVFQRSYAQCVAVYTR